MINAGGLCGEIMARVRIGERDEDDAVEHRIVLARGKLDRDLLAGCRSGFLDAVVDDLGRRHRAALPTLARVPGRGSSAKAVAIQLVRAFWSVELELDESPGPAKVLAEGLLAAADVRRIEADVFGEAQLTQQRRPHPRQCRRASPGRLP